MHHHVIGRVQPLALELIDQNGERAVHLGPRHAARTMFARNEATLPVAGVAVGKVRLAAKHRNTIAHQRVGAIAQDALVWNVAPQQASQIVEPNRSLGPATSAVNLFKARGAHCQMQEPRVINLILCLCHRFPLRALFCLLQPNWPIHASTKAIV